MTAIQFVYIGTGGEHHSGIPARDLTVEDWLRLSDEQRAVVAGSQLYRETGPATDEGNTDKKSSGKGAKAQRR